jgi:hypothetical protein
VPPAPPRCRSFTDSSFASSSDAFRQEIKRITGVEVEEAAAEIEPATGSVVHAFTTGTMVQVFHFAKHLPMDALSHLQRRHNRPHLQC